MWTKSEISSLLTSAISSEGSQTIADLFCYHYGVKDGGNVDPHQVSIGGCYVLVGFTE